MPTAGAARELLSVDPSVGLVISGVGLTSAGVVSGVVLTEERGLSRTVGRLLLLKRRDRFVSGCDRFSEGVAVDSGLGVTEGFNSTGGMVGATAAGLGGMIAGEGGISGCVGVAVSGEAGGSEGDDELLLVGLGFESGVLDPGLRFSEGGLRTGVWDGPWTGEELGTVPPERGRVGNSVPRR